MDDELHRPPPEVVAAIDQLLAHATELARGLRGYYDALVEAGFEPNEALSLTIAYQGQAFGSG